MVLIERMQNLEPRERIFTPSYGFRSCRTTIYASHPISMHIKKEVRTNVQPLFYLGSGKDSVLTIKYCQNGGENHHGYKLTDNFERESVEII